MKRIISGLDARRLPRRVVLIAAAMLAGACFAAAPTIPAAAAPTASAAGVVAPSTTGGQFGANVFVFNPSMTQDSIQSTLDSIASQQVSNQFGSQRYAVFFAPGTYGSSADPLIFQVGYYTSVAGLGRSPGDVTINGQINVYNQCFGTNCIALDNFWRSLSNLTINVTGNKPGGNDCSAATDFWAVSQAAPLRRVQVNGKLSLMDYCDGSPDYASGGFIADSGFTGPEAGTSIPLSKFFVASPGMSGATITAALARGQNLILTPGVYNLNQPIVVPHPDTVVLGLGMATLVPQRGNAAMIVVRNSGVKLSGFMIDAGPDKSPVLLSVGTPGPSDASNPDLIQDVFFRIGGAETTPVSATVSLLDNASNSILDDMGSYIVFIQTPATLFDDAAFQAPKTPAVQFHDLLVVYLGGSGGDKSIINGVGGPVTSTNNPGIGTPVNLISYP